MPAGFATLLGDMLIWSCPRTHKGRTMSAFGTGIAGLVGGVVLLMSLFSFCQRRWTAGWIWLVSGIGLIALLTFLDKPGSHSSELGTIF